jgi:hypothetical protein
MDKQPLVGRDPELKPADEQTRHGMVLVVEGRDRQREDPFRPRTVMNVAQEQDISTHRLLESEFLAVLLFAPADTSVSEVAATSPSASATYPNLVRATRRRLHTARACDCGRIEAKAARSSQQVRTDTANRPHNSRTPRSSTHGERRFPSSASTRGHRRQERGTGDLGLSIVRERRLAQAGRVTASWMPSGRGSPDRPRISYPVSERRGVAPKGLA